MTNPIRVPKYSLVFSYIRSEGYELDMNLDKVETKRKPDYTSEDKVKIFHNNIVVIENNSLLILIYLMVPPFRRP